MERTMKKFIFNITLVLCVGLFASWSLPAQDSPLVVVGNNESVPATMDAGQLKSILRGEKLRWNDGKQVVIALMKTNTPIGNETSKRVYNMTGHELNKYFLALVFQGKVKAPVFFNTAPELEAFVAQTPGAIGILDKTDEKSLQIIVVDDKTQL
jgi:hypothetical protein